MSQIAGHCSKYHTVTEPANGQPQHSILSHATLGYPIEVEKMYSKVQHKKMAKRHIVAIPSSAQGHVIPLLELMQNIAKHGFKVTFVNTEKSHARVMNALSEEDDIRDRINFVALPDGLEPWEDSIGMKKKIEAMNRFMPGKLEEVIRKIIQSEDEKVTCIIYDLNLKWPIEVAEKMQISRAVFWPAASATLASIFSIQKLIDDGIIDNRGTPIGDQIVQLSPTMPAISNKKLVWACLGDMITPEKMFEILLETNNLNQAAKWLICNSFHQLEPAAFSLFPNMLPVGPLLASNRLGKSTGNFWPEDSTCLEWLDQQQPNSVIYIAFGSFTVFDNTQFKELALGLENTNRPFLWVVRPDITNDIENAYPNGFRESVATRARIVDWAPQQAVLSHFSIACFVSHCGWNSTLESVSKGVPLLCWPYFGDQFLNQVYVCEVWKVGLGFDPDETGLVRKEEIVNKLEQLFVEKCFKARALDLKEMAENSVKESGSSHINFSNFIEWLKT